MTPAGHLGYPSPAMKRFLATFLSMLLSVVLTLASVGVLLFATRSIEKMLNPWMRALAIAAALCVGVVLLVGSIFLATQLTVFFYGDLPPASGPVLRPNAANHSFAENSSRPKSGNHTL